MKPSLHVEAAYREYQFNEVAQRLYDFFWSDYCDWFVEAAKTDIFGKEKRETISAGRDGFRLVRGRAVLHPFMPHLTEELWSLLGFGNSSIQFAAPPKSFELARPDIAKKRALSSAIYNIVQAGRNLRAESKIPSNKKVRFVLRAANEMFAQNCRQWPGY